MNLFRTALSEGAFLLDLDAQDIDTIFHQTVKQLVAMGLVRGKLSEQLEATLLERERQSSTAIGHAVAIPHAYLDGLTKQAVVFVRLSKAVNLGAPDGIPTRFLFFLLGPLEAAARHLDTLANIARLMADEEFRFDASRARSGRELQKALDRFLDRTKAQPPAKKRPSEGLVYTGRLFGGLRDDLRRRLPLYASDFRDGLNPKCLSSTLLMLFACIAPAVTFGGIMGIQTDGNIGVVEMLAATTACGVVYALFAGQPLIILGGVGPLLVFTSILFRLCGELQLPFLPAYAWVGFWTALLLVVFAATNASCLMRHFTRFTDEIFSVLMALIFIYEAIAAVVGIFRKSFADEFNNHDVAFLSLILAIGTFYIAISLSQFRRSQYLLPWMREFLADFGPTVALAGMTLVAWLLNQEVATATLQVPETFRTTTERGWLVDPFVVPLWVRLAAIGPASLAAVLVYLTHNITARLVNSPDHKLRKGPAYHLDLAVVGVLIGVCSLFGLPWLVAATVRSLSHVRSLATLEEVIMPDGAARERVTRVEETRVTGLVIHALIGLSLFLLPALKIVPMSVLYGIFLFMGVASMTGNQFFERLSLWLKDPTLYPTTHYIRRVPRWTIHGFTFLQLVCLAILWIVQGSSIGILFPVFIALLVPVRLLAGRFFSPEHLAVLDAEEEPDDEETHWAA